MTRQQKPRRKATKVDPDWKIAGYRSSLELSIAEDLNIRKIFYGYECSVISYRVEETKNYTPDFYIHSSDIYIEAKGWFKLEDRKKMLRIKEQWPDIDLRFVFQDSTNTIRKESKTTYGDWCDKNGFKYADKVVPQEWIDE